MLVGIYKLDKPNFQRKINEKYKEILQYNKIPYIELNANQPDFWDKIKELDLFIFRWAQPDDHHQIAETILPIIENVYNIKCFPNQETCWHYDDKIKEYYLFNAKGYPFTKSWIFWDKEYALKFVQNANYPIVFKLKNGAGSSNVVLVDTKMEAAKIISNMFGKGIKAGEIPSRGNLKYSDLKKYLKRKINNIVFYKRKNAEPQHWQLSKNYALFQKYLPNNSFDTRITTIGKRTFASRRFVRENDFRASGSGKTDMNPENIDMRMVKIAQKISKEMNFQSMAYDFLLNENNEPEITEISYTYADISISNSPGYFDENLNWQEGQYWPEYFDIMDGLNLSELSHPNHVSNK